MNFIKNMKLSKKIALLSISFLIFLLVIGITAGQQLASVNAKLKELNDSRLAPIIELENLKSDIEYIRSEGNLMMDASDDSTRTTIKSTISTTIANVDKELTKYQSNSEFKTLLQNYSSFKTAKDAFLTSSVVNHTTTPAQGSAPAEGSTQVQGGAPTDVTNFDKAKTTLVASFDKIINNHVAAAKKTYTDSQTMYKFIQLMLIGLMILSSVITLCLSIVIIRSIAVPVKKVTSKLHEISQSNGDLTQRISYDSKDEIGQLSQNFDLFMDKLQSIIKEVTISAQTISSSSIEIKSAASESTESLEQISSTITEIAAGTSDGAAVAEETNASLAEAAKFSEATSSASKNTVLNSKKAKEAAQNGASKINEIVTCITDIADSSKEVSVIIDDLDKSSKRIGDIIEIITSISEQTNLLALNAAIEAARAGEAGKGFNVVAEEIRKLADESNSAANEISELVKENQIKSASAVSSVSGVERKVDIGVKRASEVGQSIQGIIDNIQNVVNEIDQIDDANEQQAISIKEIEQAINTIAVTSNEIATGTENMSQSISNQLTTMTEVEKTLEKLSEMAKRLNDITSGFAV